ncbi:hypothetical protein BVRB_6g132800 [Beta vulgaris subsp. vulgaris]|nr:hypothetical protein BVRB_6g132800 [Beta vulgaris subsp. vulgaris]
MRSHSIPEARSIGPDKPQFSASSPPIMPTFSTHSKKIGFHQFVLNNELMNLLLFAIGSPNQIRRNNFILDFNSMPESWLHFKIWTSLIPLLPQNIAGIPYS